jgi:hypothetical protein
MARVVTQDRLLQAVLGTDVALATLARLLPEPDGQGMQTGTIGRTAPESSEPWNDAAAYAYWDLYFGPGNLVNEMRYAIGLRVLRYPPRGANATDVILNLAPGCPPEVVSEVCRRLEQWTLRATQIPDVDESEPWTAVPGVGGRPPECPFCHTFGLRMRRRAGEVQCFFPGCVDGDQNPTRARMEPGRMTGEARLVFGDGTMMHWSGDGK